MQLPTRDRGQGLQFDITPLIDIVFLLIIFFLVASHVVKSESKTEVKLPLAINAEDEEAIPNRLVVTITAAGEYEINQQIQPLPTVEARIIAGSAEKPEAFELRLRADESVPYDKIEPLMTACAKAGVTRIKFAVLKDQ